LFYYSKNIAVCCGIRTWNVI